MEFPKLVTGTQMGEIDRATIEDHGVPGAELMERAGGRVVETLTERAGGLEGLRVAVVCGKGNNGGDGFVVARRLTEAGVAVDTWLEAARDEVQGDARQHLERLEAVGAVGRLPEDPAAAAAALRAADVVVDALLGTGLRGAPRAPQGRVIEAIRAAGRPVFAVDVPSGVEADTGRAPGACVDAAVTVTFGLPKVGQLFEPGRSRCGTLELADIGFAAAAVEACPARARLLSAAGVVARLPARAADAHKGTCGTVAVLAGSVGMTGAAALTADSALRAGAGRVTLGTPASLNDILEVKLTEVMTRPLPEVRRARCLALRAHGEIRRLLEGADAVAVGPGLGRHRETGELVRRLLAEDLPPTVLDADGLHALGEAVEALPARGALVLTPHVGEFRRLRGGQIEEIAADPMGVSADFARRHGVVLVLKGAPTVVAGPDGAVFVNPTGNPGLATAGSGDVLTGVIVGLLARGCTALDAACCGVYLHGLAGDLTRDDLGAEGMRAGDVAGRVPRAFVELVRRPSPGDDDRPAGPGLSS